MAIGFSSGRLRPTALAACIAAAFSFTGGSPAHAGTVTNCNDSGSGSLREEVSLAGDGESVDLSGLTCSLITLTSGEVTTSVGTIDLHGSPNHRVVIDAGSRSRIIHHTGSGFLNIENLTLQNGKYSASGDAVGGCIASAGTVQLLGDIVEGCQAASTDSGGAKGGGIYGLTGIVLYATIVEGSTAVSENGDARGGGVYSAHYLRTNSTTVAGNTASGVSSFGGGAFTVGDALLQQTTVSGNAADIGAGVCLHFGSQANPSVVLVQTTISGNAATTSVGGVFSRAPLTLLNSTVTSNTEAVEAGAGVYLEGASELVSTIVSGNTTGSNPMDIGGAAGASVTGSHNLVGIPAIALPNDTEFSNDPGLDPLADNGGATRTHLPHRDSLAIQAGHAAGTLTSDQRGAGFPRSVDGGVDIGAIEYNDDIVFVNGFN